MESNTLYVDDIDIKRSKSSFATYSNEHVKYEGKYNKLNTDALTFTLQTRNSIMDALGYQILNAIYVMNYSTSRQITEYLNIVKNISVNQNIVSKKLSNFNNLSIATQQSFISDENKDGTNMKFYCLDKNGRTLLNGAGFSCNWKATDSLDNLHVKGYLIRNQYILKVYKECTKLEKVKFRSLFSGIGATYSINDNSHIILPVRNTMQYQEELLNTFNKMSNNSELLTMIDKKIIILGEDSKHIFNIFKFLATNKIMQPNIYFVTDLKLFDRELSNIFVRFGIKQNDNGIEVVMKDDLITDFK